MPKQIVQFRNDLNKIPLGKLSSQEQNLLVEVLLDLKDVGTNEVVFSRNRLLEMIPFKNLTNSQLTEVIKNLDKNFFTLHFEQLIKEQNGSETHRFINLFKIFEYNINSSGAIEYLKIQVDPDMAYILNDLTSQYTRFELADFLSMQSRYSKTLFRLLKQFRTQGWAHFDWEEFKSLMGIPESYLTRNIDQRVLKVAVNELSWDGGQTDFFKDKHGAKRPVFKNLTYEKIKGSGRGRGGKIVAIKFYFDAEKIPLTYEKNILNKITNENAAKWENLLLELQKQAYDMKCSIVLEDYLKKELSQIEIDVAQLTDKEFHAKTLFEKYPKVYDFWKETQEKIKVINMKYFETAGVESSYEESTVDQLKRVLSI